MLGVVKRECQRLETKRTYHGFVADRLDEAVEDLGKRVRADLGPSDRIRIPVHAMLPVLTHSFERRWPVGFRAPVVNVVASALGHLGHDRCRRFFRCLIHVALDRRPEGPDAEDSEANEEEIQRELGVE